jgi:hypothetical protein
MGQPGQPVESRAINVMSGMVDLVITYMKSGESIE